MAVIFYKPFAAPRTTVNILLVIVHFLWVNPYKFPKVVNTATVFPSVVHYYCRIEVSVAFMKLVISFIIVLLIPVNTSVCGIKLVVVAVYLVVVCFPCFHVVPFETILVRKGVFSAQVAVNIEFLVLQRITLYIDETSWMVAVIAHLLVSVYVTSYYQCVHQGPLQHVVLVGWVLSFCKSPDFIRSFLINLVEDYTSRYDFSLFVLQIGGTCVNWVAIETMIAFVCHAWIEVTLAFTRVINIIEFIINEQTVFFRLGWKWESLPVLCKAFL